MNFANIGFSNIFYFDVNLLIRRIETGVKLSIIPEILRIGMNKLNLRLQSIGQFMIKFVTDLFNFLHLSLDQLLSNVGMLENML